MYYKTATPAELRAAYWDERNGLAAVGDLACSVTTARGRKTAARLTAAKLRRFDIICAVARQRGIDLLADDDPADEFRAAVVKAKATNPRRYQANRPAGASRSKPRRAYA